MQKPFIFSSFITIIIGFLNMIPLQKPQNIVKLAG